MNYTEACAYLDSFVNFERKTLDHAARAEITLEGVRELSRRLGDPWRKFDSVHVAGTKGKGSTCAFAASMLRAERLRVGLYVSPHLETTRERISINGEWIPEADFARILSAFQPVLEAQRDPSSGQRCPTYFEIVTLLAFVWFAEQKVDAAVIEVGLGGRLDATNIIQPLACAVSNISLDHTAILGSTHELIAREKAGIFKSGIPVVSAPQRDDVMRVLIESAGKAGAPIEFAGREIQFESVGSADSLEAWPLPRASVKLPDGSAFSATLGLRGAHQIENWAVAVRLADLFCRGKFSRGISAEAVESGSRDTIWPGRLEELRGADSEALIFVDGAHNVHSVETVLREVRANLPTRSPLVCLFGCARDKDAAGMLAVLARERSGVDEVIFTDSCNPRGHTPGELAEIWGRIPGAKACLVEVDPRKGLGVARGRAGKTGVVLVMGSLYLAGAIRRTEFHSVHCS